MQKLDPNSNNVDLAKLTKILEDRIGYLLNHLKYIKRIQEAKIDDSEINDYLFDVFGIQKYDNKNEIISVLDEIVRRKLSFYQLLRSATLIKNNEHALAQFYLMIQYGLYYSQNFKRMVPLNKNNREKFEATFNDYYFLKSLKNSITPNLPGTYGPLSKMVTMKEIFEETIDPIQKNVQIYHVAVKFTWEILGINFQDSNIKQEAKEIKKLPGGKNKLIKNLSVTPKKHQPGSFEATFLNAVDSAEKKVAQQIRENKRFPAKTYADVYNLLNVNLALYFKIYPLFFMINAAVKKILADTKESIIQDLVNANYTKKLSTIKKHIGNLENHLQHISECLNEYAELSLPGEEKVALQQLNEEHKMLTTRINDLKSEWPETCPNTINNKEQLSERFSLFQASCLEVIKLLTAFESNINKFEDRIQEKELVKQEAFKKKREDELLNLKKQRELFNLQQAKKYELFRNEVDTKRQEKEALQKLKLLSVSSSAQDSSSTFFKNVTMQERLENLSKGQLQLLKSILAEEKGITYKEVYSLIKNQLGGKVLQVGNGSSHRRIEIANYVTEIIHYKDGTKSNMSEKSVGGLFVQHGKSHTTRELCRFNLELIANTFRRAKITIDVLKTIENKKMSDAEISNANTLDHK